MKKKIFLTVFSVLSLGIGVAVFAYGNSTGAISTIMSCCPKGAASCPMKMKHDGQTSMNHDSCPMKMKDASGDAVTSCDNCDCCKGDSCPMKHKGEASKTAADADKNADGTAAGCDCPCCHHDKKKNDGDTAV